jgi:integrase
VVVVAIDTAMRQGELLKLRPSMLRGSYLALPASITKTGKSREVPITERVAAILSRRTSGDLYFPVTSANAFRMTFIRTTKRAKLADLTFHDLRHEATSRLFECEKYQQAEIMQITGHESDAMVRRYLKTSGAELARRRGA